MKTLPALLLCFVFTNSIAQNNPIIPRNNVMYQDVMNTFVIDPGMIPCNQIVIKTDKGEIHSDKCTFSFFTKESGKVRFDVYRETAAGMQKLESINFLVRWTERPMLTIGGRTNSILKSQLLELDSLTASGQTITYPIKEFSVLVLYEETGTFKSFRNKGSMFSTEMKAAFAQTKPNDKIMFQRIIASDPYGTSVIVEAREIKIGE